MWMRLKYCYCTHPHFPYLLLFDKDGCDLSRNHRDNGSDVILKSIREATSSRDVLLVKLRHMLSHAFHLCRQSQNKYQSTMIDMHRI